MDYLLKTEPGVYSYADLQKEKETIWDGVTNPVAVRHLREMKPGDRLVIITRETRRLRSGRRRSDR
jgi:predicted RNA-binding protein with PUA-like domain